jgi:hypothetical protein
MRRIVLALSAMLGLAACSHPAPPQGRWEGAYESGDAMIAARLEIEADGMVRVSAPNVQDIGPDDRDAARGRLSADLASAWDGIVPRAMDFDGEMFRKPGGIAPQMIWKAKSKQMQLVVYLGANPGLRIPMRQVGDFSDNPFGS